MACKTFLPGILSLLVTLIGCISLPAQEPASPAELPVLEPATQPTVEPKTFDDIRQLDPQAETYSILEQDGQPLPQQQSGATAPGTFAVQEGFRPAVKSGHSALQPWSRQGAAGTPPSLPPITSNGLRNRNQENVATGDSMNEGAPSESFGDQKLDWDQPPAAPPLGRGNPPQRDATLNSVTPARGASQPSAPQTEAGLTQGGDRLFQNRNGVGVPMNTPRTDNQIRPAQFQQNVLGANQSTLPKLNTTVASQLLGRYSVDRAPDPLPGKPVRLKEMLEKTPEHLRRKMVRQYWETYYDWATLLKAAEQLKWLNQVQPPRAANDRVLLNAARQSAENQVLAAEIQLGKSQSRLKQMMIGQGQVDLLPLPSDQPLVRRYHTHYEYYDQRGQIPAEYEGINTILPKMRQLIANRAETVQTARSAANQTRNAFASGTAEIGTLLEGVRLWNDAEQILISSAVNYNQAIGDYSLSLFARGKTSEQIANMLIVKPKTLETLPAQNANAGQLRFGSNAQPAASNRSSFGGASTGQTGRIDLTPRGNTALPASPFKSTSTPQRATPTNGIPRSTTDENMPNRSLNSFGSPNLGNSKTEVPQPGDPPSAADRTARDELFGRNRSFGAANNRAGNEANPDSFGGASRRPASKTDDDNSFGGFGN